MPNPSTAQDGPGGSLLGALRSFAASTASLAHTRLELLTVELQQEVRQVGAILLWAFVAAFAALLALFLAALAVIFLFWDTHRGLASLAMIAVFVILAGVALQLMRRKLREKPPLLQDTLAELGRDRDRLQAGP